MTFRAATDTRNAIVTAILGEMDGGSGAAKLRIYTGSQPATANTAATGTLLLEFTLQDPSGTVSGDTLTIDVTPAITDDALADGTAGWGRVLDSDNNAIWDGAVGAEFTLSDTTLETGQTVTLTAGTIQHSVG